MLEVVIILLCVLVNVPFMIRGMKFNIFSGGWCSALLLVAVADYVMG